MKALCSDLQALVSALAEAEGRTPIALALDFVLGFTVGITLLVDSAIVMEMLP